VIAARRVTCTISANSADELNDNSECSDYSFIFPNCLSML
jgi:hypothetical protein